jgi:HPt (histidine-containing phosphotransfer) domain-containing protein
MTLGAPASPGHGKPGVPAIDRTVLGEWLAGDDAAINALLAVFRDSICADLVRLRDLLAPGHLDEYANTAHRLRGAALSMGARPLAEFAGLLITAARAENGDACVDGMPVLETHVRLMVAEVPTDAPPNAG